jgi:hypothetical protein
MKAVQGSLLGSLLDDNRTTISGWTQGSYTLSSVGSNNLPMSWNYRANEFLLEQNWVRLDRPVVTTGTTEPTFGFRGDVILPGSDYRFTVSRGLFDGQLTDRDGLPNFYGIDPVQFYAESYFPTVGRGLDLKLGRFYSPFGAENLDAVSNPLISHTYVFNNGEPFTHTGLLATLNVTDVWQVQAGIVLGADVFLSQAAEPTFIGSVQWTQPGGRNVVKVFTMLGSGTYDLGNNQNNFDLVDVVWTHQFNPVLVYNLECLYAWEMQNVIDDRTGFTNWGGVAQYLTYTFSPRLAGTGRLEFFDDPQGVRTNVAPGATAAGSKGLYTEVALGLTWKPCRILGSQSVILRSEVRYDYNEESAPFEGHHGLATLAADFILRW